LSGGFGIDDDLLWLATPKGGRKRGCELFGSPVKAKTPKIFLNFGGLKR